MKTALECENINDIRTEIDAIDRKIISLIGKRFEYVKAASKFKSGEDSVRAPERFRSMLLKRRDWADQEGLRPDVIEKVYIDLVTYFIEEELTHWKNQGQHL